MKGIDIFDEDNLHNILHEYYNDEQFYFSTNLKTTLYTGPNPEDSQAISETKFSRDIISVDGLLTMNIKYKGKLYIRTLYNLYPYMKIIKSVDVHFPDSYTMEDNFICYRNDNTRIIMDILNKKIYNIKGPNDIWMSSQYKNKTCFICEDKILIVDLEGNSYSYGLDTSKMESSRMRNGIFYLLDHKNIYTIDMNNNSINIIAHDYTDQLVQVCPSKYGFIYILKEYILFSKR
jgi:hypothetical protein